MNQIADLLRTAIGRKKAEEFMYAVEDMGHDELMDTITSLQHFFDGDESSRAEYALKLAYAWMIWGKLRLRQLQHMA